jgi:hypothetical protein
MEEDTVDGFLESKQVQQPNDWPVVRSGAEAFWCR